MVRLIQPQFSLFAQRMLPLLLLLGLGSCENFSPSTPEIGRRWRVTKIVHLQQKRKVGAKVYVEGTVERQAPFIGAAAYQLQDSTGSIWIFTTEPLPEIGEEMLIRGKVEYESITLDELKGQDLGDIYLQELERIKQTMQNS